MGATDGVDLLVTNDPITEVLATLAPATEAECVQICDFVCNKKQRNCELICTCQGRSANSQAIFFDQVVDQCKAIMPNEDSEDVKEECAIEKFNVEDVNQCEGNNRCSADATCTNLCDFQKENSNKTIHRYHCECNEGFRGNGQTCIAETEQLDCGRKTMKTFSSKL